MDPVARDGRNHEIMWKRRDERIGYLDFETFIVGTDCVESQALIGIGQSLLFSLGEGNSLYGLVQTMSPYNAQANEEIDIYIHISQD